jgi:hypothetical protein
MIPTYQTRSGENGNCFEACVASLLELSIVEVPTDLWSWQKIRGWLKRQGCELTFRHGNGLPLNEQSDPPLGHAIAALSLPDGSVHSVVVFDGQLVHDPSPRLFANSKLPVLLWTLIRRKTK